MQFGNLNDIAGIPIVAIVAAAAGDQPSAGSEAGGADAAGGRRRPAARRLPEGRRNRLLVSYYIIYRLSTVKLVVPLNT